MKMTATLKGLALLMIFNTVALAAQQSPSQAQERAQASVVYGQSSGKDAKPQKDNSESKGSAQKRSPAATPERLEADEVTAGREDVPAEMQANRREQLSEEEAAILPYYNNFLRSYRIGPEDVISITVFGHERYSRAGIIVPPHGTISYPLIPDGIFVAGKTTQQVQDELTKRLDEYIIEPKVTVMIEKAMSARYSVLGDVAQPGVRTMTRRLSVYEALAEAGGILNTGDKSKVYVLRRQASGQLAPIRVNIAAIEKGRAPDITYLVPGDQVFVPGNTFKKVQTILNLLPVLSFARIFTGGW
ncbi:MAG TPA: polysaccharide biosynthesis/export family protein [Pyrinomonadaceae bacterium]|nr:polysaccharide biosynthesis/export family protein [Pyrinomonadaceae bacterium]